MSMEAKPGETVGNLLEMNEAPDQMDGAVISVIDEEKLQLEEENTRANQRDLGSNDFDVDAEIEDDDRVRGAGRQSLEQLVIENEEVSWGLEEHIGGLRADRPDENPYDPTETPSSRIA